MKTQIVAYCFNIKNPEERAAWLALRAQLVASVGLDRRHKAWGGRGLMNTALYDLGVKHGVPVSVTLDPAQLFNNQWSTTHVNGTEAGLRVFDWAQDYRQDGEQHMKTGHYLAQTEEMREIRDNTLSCRYCGHKETGNAWKWCPACIGSEYLTEKGLRLTRMLPVSADKCGPELSKKERAELDAKLAKKIKDAQDDHAAHVWLYDVARLPSRIISNVIFYNHTGRYGFGWREPMNAEDTAAVLDIISESPFPYDIKCADGRKLSGG